MKLKKKIDVVTRSKCNVKDVNQIYHIKKQIFPDTKTIYVKNSIRRINTTNMKLQFNGV